MTPHLKRLTPALLAAAFLATPAHATVTWSFIETEIVSCKGPLSCPAISEPIPLLSFTISSTTSTGTATGFRWNVIHDPLVTTTTDPAFTYSINDPGLWGIYSYNFTWTETDAQLTDVNIAFSAGDITISHLNLTTGNISADNIFGGCTLATAPCEIAGFWVDSQTPSPVPEPAPVLMLLAGLAMLGFVPNLRGVK